MKLRECEIKFDLNEGARFKELLNHPHYLSLDKTTQIEYGLQWARGLYQQEVEKPSIDKYFPGFDLSQHTKGSIMLDIGCYLGGKTVRWLEKYHGTAIHGIDIDPRFIQIAESFAREKKANAHFKVNFAEKLDFPDSFFDVILTEQTLEHVRDIQKCMNVTAY
jgi:2-polyprenyl-3-methyl-5-hydroxy-6-metoxy-1,4-benzoquinol methylase